MPNQFSEKAFELPSNRHPRERSSAKWKSEIQVVQRLFKLSFLFLPLKRDTAHKQPLFLPKINRKSDHKRSRPPRSTHTRDSTREIVGVGKQLNIFLSETSEITRSE